jgi:hypothetical protein
MPLNERAGRGGQGRRRRPGGVAFTGADDGARYDGTVSFGWARIGDAPVSAVCCGCEQGV